MKQHILAIGAAAALFGFAGAAHAVVSFGVGQLPPESKVVEATELKQNAGGIGHMLFAPYYNVQDGTNTLINIANTDTKNGKAVKVRFRNASNSDDVLDFTLLLSPGDVWSASLQTRADGTPAIFTSDTSCVLPNAEMQSTGVDFVALRLPDVSDEAKKILMSEGYLEVLNMADIPPSTVYNEKTDSYSNSDLYKEIKHSNGKPSCNYYSEILQHLIGDELDERFVEPGKAGTKYGLYAPTGGLLGSWIVQNQNLLNSYSGNMTAIRAEADGVPGYTNLVFAPQNGLEIEEGKLEAQFGKAIADQYAVRCLDLDEKGVPIGDHACVAGLTADPLLFSPGAVTPLWFDFPDMSTPLLKDTKTPQDQVTNMALEQSQLYNFYVSDANGSTPMATDWVVSQPTRRYYVAVDYKVNGLLWNETMGVKGEGGVAGHAVSKKPNADNNAYANVQIDYPKDKVGLGPFACLLRSVGSYGTVDTEENAGSTSLGIGAFSPGKPADKQTLCGEVMVLGFAPDSVFNAKATRSMWPAEEIPAAGLAQLSFGGLKLPLVGFAATSYTNAASGASYGATMAHRWN